MVGALYCNQDSKNSDGAGSSSLGNQKDKV